MPENLVSMTRYQNAESIQEAIAGCDGFAALKSGDTVLVKPNLVGWDNQGPYPPWGVLTTSTLIDGLCATLKDAGAKKILIGEGSVQCEAIGSSTGHIYDRLGYHTLVKRYGVELIDFNEGEFEKIDIAPGHWLKVTHRMADCDFLISAPVLKTHGTCVVSLGIKNLKGLLHSRSKSYCHHADGLLDQLIAKLGTRFAPALTIIDGIYALEQGPLHFGRAHRKDLLLASTDVYAADLLGAYLLGYAPADVGYLNEWAKMHGRTTDVADLTVRTDLDIEQEKTPLKWDWEWAPDNSGPEAFAKAGIAGIRLPKYDQTLCTGCSYMFNPLMLSLLSTSKKEFDDYEILTGKAMSPSPNATKTFLFGKCQVKKNANHPDCQNVVTLKGCPPSLDMIERTFQENGVPVNRATYDGYRKHLMKRYWKEPKIYRPGDYFLDDVPIDLIPPAKT